MSLPPPRHAKVLSLGGVEIRRALPFAGVRKVGPWVFLDHFGPAVLGEGGLDVGPHPHCGLSTVTWLLEGQVEHRDSTGGHGIARPGEIHWMRAGHGITHSERTPAAHRQGGARLHGLQLWCAHPDGHEEQEPGYQSWGDLPRFERSGVSVQLLAGEGWGRRSPVAVTSPLVLAVAELGAGQRLMLPDAAELAIYVLSGTVGWNGQRIGPHALGLVNTGVVEASDTATIALLGGDPIGERFMWWNLVHSDRERLREQAARYRRGAFPAIPEDPGFLPAPPAGP